MFLQIERCPIRSAAAHVGHVLANRGPGGKVALGVAPWSGAWPNRANETVVILPALLCLGPPCFQVWLHAVLRVLNLPLYTEGPKLWTA